MRHRNSLGPWIGLSLCTFCVFLFATTAVAVDIPFSYNLPWNEANRATLVGDLDRPINETQTKYPHASGHINGHLYASFNPSTHVPTLTGTGNGISFTYNNPGWVDFENISADYGNSFTGATMSTHELKGTVYTPGSAIVPVNASGIFDNTLNRVEVNSGTAHAKLWAVFIPVYEGDFNFATKPANSQGQGTAGPVTFSAPTNPHNISSSITTGYHVTYDYTTTLQVPINVTQEIKEDTYGHIGWVTITASLTTDPYAFSQTFNYLPGDANLDGTVNTSDLNAIATHWRQSTSGWNNGDFDGSGTVNTADLNALATHWRQSASGPSLDEALALYGLDGELVPEPSAVAMFIGMLGLLGMRWLVRCRNNRVVGG